MSFLTVLLSFAPILVLLICLLWLKLSAAKAGVISFFVAVAGSLVIFKPGIMGLSISISKGFGLALFVILIIWGAMFLYNLVNETGALKVINRNIEAAVDDKFCQFLMLAWIFSAFLQGIAGFGVPVIIVTPILISMGFNPVKSAAAVLVGHSWAISFGSMGSSISAIDLVTDADPTLIVFYMALFGTIAMVLMGVAVAWIYGGVKQIVRGMVYILFPSLVMGGTLFLLAKFNMTSVIGLSTGGMGMLAILLTYKIFGTKSKFVPYRESINAVEAMSPYIFIIILSIAFFVIDPTLQIALDFPGYISGNGQVIEPELAYTKFNILKYPFSVMMFSSFFASLIYWKKGVLSKAKMKKIINATVTKCTGTTITLVFLLSMAQIMMDSGMINSIAQTLVAITGQFYPVFSPIIGLLGAFVTGSNTNSNVLFGNLQETAANSLGLQAALMCGAQSIGASIGGGIGPTTVALGAGAAGASGEESKIYKLTLPPILLGVLVLGVINYLIVNF